MLVQLIRKLVPEGRPVLRIGGQSADRTWAPVRGIRQPLGITYDLTPGWMTSARALAQATNARLILGVGLEANQPKIDAVEADQLVNGLGRKYIAALEIGNEPELYTLVPWYRKLHGTPIPWYSHVGVPVFSRPPGYDPSTFFAEFSRTLRVLPQLPIAAPSTGLLSWLDGIRQFLGRASRVRIVTWHAYGLNQCVLVTSSPQYPTVPNLLAHPASRGIVNGISPYVALAHRVGATFRIDEMNSVTCNGRLGVSNTFASALWVMDALFTAASDGVDGVNIHTFQNAANGLFDFDHAHGRWEGAVHPLYYGVMMFAQAAPPGSRLLRIYSGSQDQVRAWATLAPDHRIRVLLINDSLSRSALALVHTPVGSGPASIERLLSPSAYATGSVSLGGRSFGARTSSGRLRTPQVKVVAPRSGAYSVTLPAASAALLTLPPPGNGKP
ncbi:MAG: glycosyl hydrolase family 79 C-terminal domain-containing protein [Solirubrobacteraceae bacterium]